ncbi:MAG: PAS domain S-box protein [Undibacterium sp.]|nr:PAS domain S-box protein [Undibacterium sp.]
MIEFLNQFFSTDGFMPHGHCYLWTPSLLWTYVVSDAVIALSYFSIPFALMYFLNKRRDIPFNWIIVMFAAFILSCGITHLISILTIWHPVYGLDASAKAVTALMSVLTAVMLWPLIPLLLKVPNIKQLQALNAQLQIDVAARKQSELKLLELNKNFEQQLALRTEALLKEGKRLRQVVDSAPNAMVMINPSGEIKMVNTQTERVFGYAREELLGQSIEMLVPERYRHHHPTLRSSFFADPNSRPMGKGRDLFGRRKDGSEFPIEIGLNPIDTDEGIKVLSAIVDISERKAKEIKIEAALVEKNILLGEIHHRVKNNLQIIHSLLDLQSTRVEDQKILDILRDSQNRIRSMAIIHQTLYQANDFVNVNFATVLEYLVPAIAETYSLKRDSVTFFLNAFKVFIPINLAIPCGLIVNELIANALKHAFTDREYGTITVALTQQGQQITLSVSDNGVGIAADIDIENHTSLGLQLVYLLADQLHATLTITRRNPTCFALVFSANTS